jgi:hypothetical protein
MVDILTAEQVTEIWRKERGIPQAHEMARVLDSHEALRARCEQAEREREEARRFAEENFEQFIDEKELHHKATERIAALEAHIRELREQLLYELGTHDGPTGLIDKSLALAPDETGASDGL